MFCGALLQRIPTTFIGLAGRSLRDLRAHASGADRVEATGATCYVLDPVRFRIITDSWNKTDRQDARNMAKALWVFLVTGPGRRLRRLRGHASM